MVVIVYSVPGGLIEVPVIGNNKFSGTQSPTVLPGFPSVIAGFVPLNTGIVWVLEHPFWLRQLN